MEKFTVFALYQFVSVEDPIELQKELLKFKRFNDLRGTLIIAKEGINGTIAAHEATIIQLESWFKTSTPFQSLMAKKHTLGTNPFLRFKVKIKKEIVTMGQENAQPTQKVGQYVDPKQWNSLIQEKDVLVLDTRNDYETAIGTFKGSIDPKTKTFKAFADFVKKNMDPNKNKKIAMFCTGGIRCEKASSWMLNEGFENVYHLKGGVLDYFKDVNAQESLWEGDCFVFDQRVALNHQNKPSGHTQCYACRMPLTLEQTQHKAYKPGVACEFCVNEKTNQQKARYKQRHLQQQLAKAKGKQHIGVTHES